MDSGRQRVFNFAKDTFNPEFLLEKVEVAFDSLKCATSLTRAIGFVLENVEDISYRYYYAHEKTTQLEQSKHMATTEDLTKRKNLLSNIDVIESSTREHTNTKWNFYKLINVTFFAALLNEFPMKCRDAILPDALIKNQSVKCLTLAKSTRKMYNDVFCLFRAPALHLHGNERLEEEISNKLFNQILKKTGPTDLQIFEVFIWKKLHQWRTSSE